MYPTADLENWLTARGERVGESVAAQTRDDLETYRRILDTERKRIQLTAAETKALAAIIATSPLPPGTYPGYLAADADVAGHSELAERIRTAGPTAEYALREWLIEQH